MYMKIHQTDLGRIVAVCDNKLIDTILSEGSKQIDLKNYKSFYVGKEVGADEVKKALDACSSANLIGKEAVEIAVLLELVDEKTIGYINGIPHVQIYKL